MNTTELEDSIGQLFILGFQGASLSSQTPVVEDITRHNLGGVLLFDRNLAMGKSDNNIIDARQVKELTAALQKTAALNNAPLLIAVDQEGGTVSRFKQQRGFAETASAEQLAADSSLKSTREAAAQTAALLAATGINLNFAPVVDLNIFPENPIIGKLGRSFGNCAETVAQHAAAWIDEHHKRKILTCLKHFPGHGSSHTDSHLDFVDISESWQEKELHPYRLLIEQQKADAVMVGHLFHRDFDRQYPATLSAKAINLLRNKLQFTAPIIADDMQMKAITRQYGLAEACSRTIAAGVDLIIIGNNLEYDADILKKVKAALLQDVKKGIIKESRIVEAWQRIQQFKNRIITR